jgi:hypothetical protein
MSYPRPGPLGSSPSDVARTLTYLLRRADVPTFPNLTDAVDDAAAAAAGVPVNGVYRNGSVLMVRVA